MIWCVDDDSTIRDIEVYTLTQTGFEAEGFAGWRAHQLSRPHASAEDLPQGGKQLPDLTIETGRFAGNATELWSYQVAGKSIAVMPITHPSAGYSIECFNAFFRELIGNI